MDEPAPDASPLTLDMAAVAVPLWLSQATTPKWDRSGTMPAYRVGRSWIVFRREIDVWLVSTGFDALDSASLPPLEDLLAPLPPFLRLAEGSVILRVSQTAVSAFTFNRQVGAVNLASTRRVPLNGLQTFLSAARNNA
jgi:hypothetical protein